MPRCLSKAEEEAMEETIRQEVTMYADGYDLQDLLIRIPSATTIDGAIVALCPDGDGTVTADVCIDGPPVP